MNKEELIAFLKENLQISVCCNCDGCGDDQITVSLLLENKIISEYSDYLPTRR